MYSPIIEKLIVLFSKFPTIGPRTAKRFVFYLLHLEKKEIQELTSSILELKEKVKLCKSCYKSFDFQGDLCEICKDVRRDKSLICLIQKETDLVSIEKTKKYQGLYYILDGNNLKKIKIKELLEKIKNPQIKEVIIALNPTTEGETISLYLERKLKPFNKKITRLGRGMPTGGELEYTDEETISSALEGRKQLK
jgi:recombination protein RecR